MRTYDPDYGLTWEEKLERRIKEAREKQRESERLAIKKHSELEEIKIYIFQLKEMLNRGNEVESDIEL